MSVQELREQRATRITEMQGLVTKAEGERRDLSEKEQQRFDTLKGEVRGIDTRIEQRETLDTFERHAEASPMDRRGGGGIEALEARYSIGRAIDQWTRDRRLSGVEGEYAQEMRSGRDNAFAAPVSAFLGEARYVGTQTPSAGPGGTLVATTLGPLIDRPRPQLQVQRLGATTLSGLTNDLDLPRLKSSSSVDWVAEHGEGPQQDPAFDKISMSPHTCTGNLEMSRRMMIQAPQIEQVLRSDIGFMLAQSLDLMALRGTGVDGKAPTGIKNVAGVKHVTFGSGTAIQNYVNATAAMIGAIDDANLSGGTGFLSSPKVRAKLNTLLTDQGLPFGISSFFHQERVEWSTQVPSNLGTGTDKAELYYGAWSNLLIGYWSSVDILLNPYADSIAKKGGALLHAFLDADVAVRHPEAFAYSDDVPTALAA